MPTKRQLAQQDFLEYKKGPGDWKRRPCPGCGKSTMSTRERRMCKKCRRRWAKSRDKPVYKVGRPSDTGRKPFKGDYL